MDGKHEALDARLRNWGSVYRSGKQTGWGVNPLVTAMRLYGEGQTAAGSSGIKPDAIDAEKVEKAICSPRVHAAFRKALVAIYVARRPDWAAAKLVGLRAKDFGRFFALHMERLERSLAITFPEKPA